MRVILKEETLQEFCTNEENALEHSKQLLKKNLTLNIDITKEKEKQSSCPQTKATTLSININRNQSILTNNIKASINNPKQNLCHKKAKMVPGWEGRSEQVETNNKHQLLDAKHSERHANLAYRIHKEENAKARYNTGRCKPQC